MAINNITEDKTQSEGTKKTSSLKINSKAISFIEKACEFLLTKLPIMNI